MEKALKDAVNFAIGAVKSVSEEGEKALEQLKSTFSNLEAKGAAANDETSEKVKNIANETIEKLGGLQAQVEELVKKANDKIQEVLPKKEA